jgi:hypothetical protein
MTVRLRIAVRAAVLLMVALLVGCSGDAPSPSTTAGSGGTGFAGSMQAGMGAVAGTGGPAAGSGGSSGMLDLTCASAAKGTPAQLHAGAVMALLPQGNNKGCAFGSCHDLQSMKANLVLLEQPNDLNKLLVGKASCEAPTLPLVDASGGDAALAKSWLWQKFVAPAGPDGQMIPKPEWGTAVLTCGQEQGFGLRMPRSQTADLLTESKLTAVRDWICAGAPGPNP